MSAEISQLRARCDRLFNALIYAHDAIVKLADHSDIEAVEAEGLDVQDCRDMMELAIEDAGGEVPE